MKIKLIIKKKILKKDLNFKKKKYDSFSFEIFV